MYTPNKSLIESAYSNARPTTYDYLRPNAFRFNVKELPHVSYTCQAVNIPALTLGITHQPTPFLDINTMGDKMMYGDLMVRFIISEDMSNYVELFNWLVALGFPNEYNQYSSFISKRASSFPYADVKRGNSDVAAYSDATLTILDSSNNPKIDVVFTSMFPVSLETLEFDITNPTMEYFTGFATFRYKTFEIKIL